MVRHLLGVFIVGGAILTTGHAHEGHAPSSGQSAELDKSIALFAERLERAPKSAGNLVILARLHMRRAKEQHRHADYQRAEQLLRRVLRLEPESIGSKLLLAQAVAAQHRFQESLQLGESVLTQRPKSAAALAVVFDAQLELGKYDAADSTLRALVEQAGDSPEILAREARLGELRGQTDVTIAKLQQAFELAQAADNPPLQVAWHLVRLGEVLAAAGDCEAARGKYLDALRISPDDPQALAGLARLLKRKGDTAQAEEYYRRSLKIANSPPVLAELGDLLIKTGRRTEGVELIDRAELIMEGEAKQFAAAHWRERAMFLLDHDRKLELALKLARQDLDNRHDIYAYDTLAWALFKNGQLDEAAQAIAKALSLGTRDAQLHRHAAAIYEQLGQPETAQEHAQLARELDLPVELPGM